MVMAHELRNENNQVLVDIPYRNYRNWIINKYPKFYNKFSESFQFEKLSKFQKLANFGVFCPFDIPYKNDRNWIINKFPKFYNLEH